MRRFVSLAVLAFVGLFAWPLVLWLSAAVNAGDPPILFRHIREPNNQPSLFDLRILTLNFSTANSTTRCGYHEEGVSGRVVLSVKWNCSTSPNVSSMSRSRRRPPRIQIERRRAFGRGGAMCLSCGHQNAILLFLFPGPRPNRDKQLVALLRQLSNSFVVRTPFAACDTLFIVMSSRYEVAEQHVDTTTSPFHRQHQNGRRHRRAVRLLRLEEYVDNPLANSAAGKMSGSPNSGTSSIAENLTAVVMQYASAWLGVHGNAYANIALLHLELPDPALSTRTEKEQRHQQEGIDDLEFVVGSDLFAQFYTKIELCHLPKSGAALVYRNGSHCLAGGYRAMQYIAGRADIVHDIVQGSSSLRLLPRPPKKGGGDMVPWPEELIPDLSLALQGRDVVNPTMDCLVALAQPRGPAEFELSLVDNVTMSQHVFASRSSGVVGLAGDQHDELFLHPLSADKMATSSIFDGLWGSRSGGGDGGKTSSAPPNSTALRVEMSILSSPTRLSSSCTRRRVGERTIAPGGGFGATAMKNQQQDARASCPARNAVILIIDVDDRSNSENQLTTMLAGYFSMFFLHFGSVGCHDLMIIFICDGVLTEHLSREAVRAARSKYRFPWASEESNDDMADATRGGAKAAVLGQQSRLDTRVVRRLQAQGLVSKTLLGEMASKTIVERQRVAAAAVAAIQERAALYGCVAVLPFASATNIFVLGNFFDVARCDDNIQGRRVESTSRSRIGNDEQLTVVARRHYDYSPGATNHHPAVDGGRDCDELGWLLVGPPLLLLRDLESCGVDTSAASSSRPSGHEGGVKTFVVIASSREEATSRQQDPSSVVAVVLDGGLGAAEVFSLWIAFSGIGGK